MTAPMKDQPPRDQPSHDPWQTPWPEGPEEGGRSAVSRAEVVEALVLTVVIAVSGLLLGYLWELLAPRVPLIVRAGNVLLADSEAEHAVAIDGTFALLGLAFGALWAAGVFLWRRRGGVPYVLALAVGGLLGALLAWQVGVWLGPTEDVVAHARAVGEGKIFDAPLQLKAKTALLAWPLGAMLVQLLLTGLFGPRDPDPGLPAPLPAPMAADNQWQGWGQTPERR
ncbi:DUF2567 domain-containing protein [Streptomyces polyrhachis]|uniref:DUF2567 domain-containing protein n=1 Tax=Streptomyces polyrhachis TaxID=1282885 RepID=A0ABW2G7F1_9ACTN